VTTNDPDKSRAELERALGAAPAYSRWRHLDPGPAAGIDARYAALPATTKRWMHSETFRRFVPAGADVDAALADDDNDLEIVLTSGTADEPTPLVWCQDWWDASERASWTLNAHASEAATGTHREAVLASPRCVGPGMHDHPLSMDERTLETFLFLNEDPDVARWTDETIRRMRDELDRFDPAVLEADPWYLAAFCARAEKLGLALKAPKLIVFTYTLPSKVHLARIARALPVPMASSYGSTETGYVFLSCEHGRMHQSVDSCRVDLVSLSAEAGDARIAKLLVTPFGNPWMCLLRFDIGDLARPATAPCPCGRTEGLAIDRIEGRVDDATLRTDGRVVCAAAIDDAIASTACVSDMVSYQIDQIGRRDYLLRATATGPIDTLAIRACLRDVYGPDASVSVESVEALQPEPSGKYLRARIRFDVDRNAWFEQQAGSARICGDVDRR
jgi:phenylacetate-CoA ligase